MELFDAKGHITDAGFSALLTDQPDMLSRLELTEHLSFCDKCCARYADLLSGDVLLMPPEPIAPKLMERIRRRAKHLLFNRFVKVGLAASLAMGLWLTGINYGIIPIAPPAESQNASALLSTGFPAQSGSTALKQFTDTQQKNANRMRASLDAVTSDILEDPLTLNMKISKALDQLLSSISHKGDHQS